MPGSPLRPAARRWRTALPAALVGCVLIGPALLAADAPPRPEGRAPTADRSGPAPAPAQALPAPAATLSAPALAQAVAGSAAAAPAPPGAAVPAPPGAGGASAPAAATSPTPVLRLPGPVPSTGRGEFRYDDRAGPVLGRAGALRRFRVAVERETGEDPREFGAAVQETLAGPGSWVDGGRLRLRRVPGGARHDFTVYLATARTAARMCAAGGVDIRVGGQPYTSCRAPGKVIINLDRWRTSVPHFVSAGVPLAVYRAYVVNHEVGHELGHRHEGCPKRGRPAPVMMQQTLFLKGCLANPWPYRDGRRYAGPRL
jgi:hypothetical protein